MNMNWLLESNRYKHFLFAIPFGLFLTILCVIGLAIGMEFKDCQYANQNISLFRWNWRNWDWFDFIFTLLGGIFGQVIQLIIILNII